MPTFPIDNCSRCRSWNSLPPPYHSQLYLLFLLLLLTFDLAVWQLNPFQFLTATSEQWQWNSWTLSPSPSAWTMDLLLGAGHFLCALRDASKNKWRAREPALVWLTAHGIRLRFGPNVPPLWYLHCPLASWSFQRISNLARPCRGWWNCPSMQKETERGFSITYC